MLNWETEREVANLGFNVYRATAADGERTKLNAAMIPTLLPPGSPFGAAYEYTDGTMRGKKMTYYYWLEDVEISGKTTLHGPVSAMPQ